MFRKSNYFDFGNVFSSAERKKFCTLALPCNMIAGNERNTVFARC